MYKDLIESVGEESEAPRDAPVVDFMEWLENELAIMSNHMTIRREYASFVSLRTFHSSFGRVRVWSSQKVRDQGPADLLECPQSCS
jgi:hypothetical protein